MNFDELHTFDINGTPDFKLDLQEPLNEKFNNYYDWIFCNSFIFNSIYTFIKYIFSKF
tara:strand:+ start:304 stop:477 length:174 start_codon:yes stop_codon:yes gene_type:complete